MVDMKAMFELLRPANSLMIGLAVVVGRFITHYTLNPLLPTLLGSLAGFLFGGASMVSNDYLDQKVDAINAPGRPIPSGRVSPQEALILSLVLSVAGLIVAYLTNFLCFIISVVGLLIFLAYNYRGKQFGIAGNLMVSIGLIFPLLYGAFAEWPRSTLRGSLLPYLPISSGTALLIIFGLMVVLANTGREVNKGIADVEGDKIRDVRTVAREYGSNIAAKASSVLYLAAVLTSIVPWLLDLVSWLYLPLIFVADLGFGISALLLIRDYSKESALRVKQIVLLWMLIGLLGFVAGGL